MKSSKTSSPVNKNVQIANTPKTSSPLVNGVSGSTPLVSKSISPSPFPYLLYSSSYQLTSLDEDLSNLPPLIDKDHFSDDEEKEGHASSGILDSSGSE
ncbi:20967_t:CDS:2 [Entrophospora sp. SA101]|nr:20967_t:CDS:2 [Entrophospora sp. SA101]